MYIKGHRADDLEICYQGHDLSNIALTTRLEAFSYIVSEIFIFKI